MKNPWELSHHEPYRIASSLQLMADPIFFSLSFFFYNIILVIHRMLEKNRWCWDLRHESSLFISISYIHNYLLLESYRKVNEFRKVKIIIMPFIRRYDLWFKNLLSFASHKSWRLPKDWLAGHYLWHLLPGGYRLQELVFFLLFLSLIHFIL